MTVLGNFISLSRGLHVFGLSAALAATAGAQPPPDYLFQESPAAETPAAETPSTQPETPSSEPQTPSPSTPATPDGAAAAPSDEAAVPEVNDDALEALQRANIAISQGDAATALAAADEAISLQPDFFEAFALKNLIHRLTGNFSESLRAADQAIAINPSAPNGYLNRALTYLEMKEYDKGLADVEEALKYDAKNPQAFVVAGLIHAKRKNWEKMADAYTKAIDFAAAVPSSLGDSLMQRGIAMFHLGEYEVAKLDFEQAGIYGGGAVGEANRWRGYVFAVQGDYYRAIRWFDRALRANPANGQAHRNRGMAYLNLAATEPRSRDFALRQAVASFNAAIRLNPNDARLYYRRGVAYDRLGSYESARSSYQTAARLDPKLPEVQDKLSAHEGAMEWVLE